MNFLGLLKTVGKDLFAADLMAAPIVSLFNPGIGAAMNVIGRLVIKAEQTYAMDGQGTKKYQLVVDEFNALLPDLQAELAKQGVQLNIDPAALTSIINAIVAQLNAAQAGIKVVPVAKTT